MIWDDLTIKLSEEEIRRAYSPWPFPLREKILPIMITVFGDLFFINENLKIFHLDTIGLKVHNLNIFQKEFDNYIQNEEVFKSIFMPDLILEIQKNGKKRKENQVYGFAPHPCLTGSIKAEFSLIMDLLPWISICSQLYIKE